jgi:hypothetical protein
MNSSNIPRLLYFGRENGLLWAVSEFVGTALPDIFDKKWPEQKVI